MGISVGYTAPRSGAVNPTLVSLIRLAPRGQSNYTGPCPLGASLIRLALGDSLSRLAPRGQSKVHTLSYWANKVYTFPCRADKV